MDTPFIGNEKREPVVKECTCPALTFEMRPCEGQDYPKDLNFTPQEMVGRYFSNQFGSRSVCAYIEHVPDDDPVKCFIPDFTTDLSKFKGMTASEWTLNSIHWRNMEQNLKDMQLTLDHLPQYDTVFCVGSGPALMKNWPELLRVKGKPGCCIVGCNELLQYLPAGLLDYYLALDASSPDKWWDGWECSETTAIFGPCIPPSFKRAGWKRVLWYRIGLQSAFNSFVNNSKGHLTTLIPCFGVGPAELQVAWLMRPKRVVLVGHSYAYDMIDGVVYEHINEPLTEARWEGILAEMGECATTDIEGKPVVTDYHILITGAATLAHCQILQDNGVQVINATEGGIVRSNPDLPAYRNRPIFPELVTLKDVVDEALK